MAQGSELQVEESGTVIVRGDLTFQTVSSLFQALPEPAEAVLTLDLSSVNAVDSAGLALLLEWRARLPEGKTLRIVKAPENLLKLARLCEATELLAMGTRD